MDSNTERMGNSGDCRNVFSRMDRKMGAMDHKRNEDNREDFELIIDIISIQ
jgi:hypothetical protein